MVSFRPEQKNVGLAYRRDGRLYATHVFPGDAPSELAGAKPLRKILERMGA